MSETKDDIDKERTELRERVGQLEEENAALRAGQGAVPAVGRAVVPQHTFQLSEGDRQELEQNGVVSIGGRLVTKTDVQAMIAERGDGSQDGVEIADPTSPAAKARADAAAAGTINRGDGIRGVDFVYPSVRSGEIDPAVAGTPGISGPPATDVPTTDPNG